MSRRRSASSPLATKARLRPFSGTTSATVPSATMSSQPSRSGSGRASRPEAARAQHAVDRDHGEEHEADGGEMAEPRQIVEPVGIDHDRIRQALVGLVMIEHDHIEAKPPRLGQRLDAGGAAIDGDEQRRAAVGERADRLDVGAVAFENPVGDMHDRLAAADPHEARQQRRRGRAIDVVVAEDRDLLAAQHGVGEALRRLLHRGDGVRVGHQPPHRRIEERLDLVDLDAAAGQDARQQLRHIVPLRDRQRARRRPLVEPVPPGPAADRTLDVEKQARGCLRRQRQSDRHDNPHPNRRPVKPYMVRRTRARIRAAGLPQSTAANA